MDYLEDWSEPSLSMVEIKEILDKIKKRDKELTPRGIKTHDYISKLTKSTTKQINELREKINKLGISRLKEKHINKIIDINPKDQDSIKSILNAENITLKQEDITKLVETLK